MAQLTLLPGHPVSSAGFESAGITSFTAETLHDYLGEGADLVLEYGIDTLEVVRVISDGREIMAEIYRMRDPEAAFGIFSVSRFRCSMGVQLTAHQCRSACQFQFSKGHYYVNIINDTGSEADQKSSELLAAAIITAIGGPLFDPAGYYAGEIDEEMMRGALLVRGPLGVHYGAPLLIGKLGTVTGYTALLIKKGHDIIASLRFNSAESAEAFMIDRKITPDSPGDVMPSGPAVSLFSPGHLIITF